jgi:hypothetical protein
MHGGDNMRFTNENFLTVLGSKGRIFPKIANSLAAQTVRFLHGNIRPFFSKNCYKNFLKRSAHIIAPMHVCPVVVKISIVTDSLSVSGTTVVQLSK